MLIRRQVNVLFFYLLTHQSWLVNIFLEKSLAEKAKQADLANETNANLIAVTDEKNVLDSRLQSLSSTLEAEVNNAKGLELTLAKLQTALDVKNGLLDKLSIW